MKLKLTLIILIVGFIWLAGMQGIIANERLDKLDDSANTRSLSNEQAIKDIKRALWLINHKQYKDADTTEIFISLGCYKCHTNEEG